MRFRPSADGNLLIQCPDYDVAGVWEFTMEGGLLSSTPAVANIEDWAHNVRQATQELEELMAFFGVYVGVVCNNSDPQQAGRVQIRVPALGATAWALVASPVGSITTGTVPNGASVVVAFERGDLSHPIVLRPRAGCSVSWDRCTRMKIRALRTEPRGIGLEVSLSGLALQSCFSPGKITQRFA